MQAQIVSSDQKEIKISMMEVDIGILYIIQHELLKTSSVDFAGVIVKYPLTNECWIQINSKSKPIPEIKNATETALKTTNELQKLFNSVIKVS
jgi:DNA-directed RNA polymerase subunit L